MTKALAVQSQVMGQDQVDLVKRTVAKDATNDELKMFLHLAQTYNLDPFAKEIWFIKQGGQPLMMTSRDGYLKIANEHKDFEGMASDVVYAEDSFERSSDGVKHVYGGKDRGVIVGAYALVYRKDRRIPVYVFAPYKDYAKGNNVWRTYPHAMILKVAEAMALKRAFSLSGLVTREEVDSGDGDAPEVINAEVVEHATQQPKPETKNEWDDIFRGYVTRYGSESKAKHAVKEVLAGRPLNSKVFGDLRNHLESLPESDENGMADDHHPMPGVDDHAAA